MKFIVLDPWRPKVNAEPRAWRRATPSMSSETSADAATVMSRSVNDRPAPAAPALIGKTEPSAVSGMNALSSQPLAHPSTDPPDAIIEPAS